MRKEMDTIKKKELKLLEQKIKISEMKNWLDGLNILDTTEKSISKLEDSAMDTIKSEIR